MKGEVLQPPIQSGSGPFVPPYKLKMVLKLAHLFGKIATSKFLKGISVGKFNSAPGHKGQYSFGGNAVLIFLVGEYVTHS